MRRSFQLCWIHVKTPPWSIFSCWAALMWPEVRRIPAPNRSPVPDMGLWMLQKGAGKIGIYADPILAFPQPDIQREAALCFWGFSPARVRHESDSCTGQAIGQKIRINQHGATGPTGEHTDLLEEVFHIIVYGRKIVIGTPGNGGMSLYGLVIFTGIFEKAIRIWTRLSILFLYLLKFLIVPDIAQSLAISSKRGKPCKGTKCFARL